MIELKKTGTTRAVSALLASFLVSGLIAGPTSAAPTTFTTSDFTAYGLGGTSGTNMVFNSSYVPISNDSNGTLTWELTQNGEPWRAGSIFYKNRIDLTQDFEVNAEIFLGTESALELGGDGMAFVLQPTSATDLSGGGGLGYGAMEPVVAVEYDTWRNAEFGDIDFGTGAEANQNLIDAWGLISRPVDGSATNSASHNSYGVTVGGAKQFSAGQLEDEQWRKVRYFWDASAGTLTAQLDINRDGDFLDTDESKTATIALATVLASSNVYWGFTAANGGVSNNHAVRFPANAEFTATSRVNTGPTISAVADDDFTVADGAQTYSYTLSDDSTTQAQWLVSVSSSNASVATATASITGATAAQAVVTPVAAGTATITVTVTDADGATASDSFVVGVTSPPSAPTSVSATASGLSANISWNAPTNTGGLAITGYKVEINDGNGWTTAVANTGSASTSYTASGLTLGTSYTFRVSAINSLGTSSASTASSSITISGSAPGAPKNLAITYTSSDTATVSWEAPDSIPGLAVTDYVVEYEIGGSWIALTESGTTAQVTNVSQLGRWSFRVAATNAVGTGVYATKDYTPPSPYAGPIVTNLSLHDLVANSPVIVEIRGERLDSVTGASVDGLALTILSKSEGALTVQLPGLTVGEKNLVLVSTNGVLTHQDAFLVKSVAEQPTPVSERKVNAGSFKGFVALYAKGYAGHRFTAKVGNDWVIVEKLASDYERIVEFTGSGYEINLRVFIDRELVMTRQFVTK